MVIKETIIVEGRHDMSALRAVVKANIIITQGSYLSQKILETIRHAYNHGGIIIFTDSDPAGKKLRERLTEAFPDAKQAMIPRKLSTAGKKTGVEHASPQEILKALEGCISHVEETEPMTLEDMLDLGLSGNPEAQKKRYALALRLGFEEGNTKHFIKQCQFRKITKEQLIHELKQSH